MDKKLISVGIGAACGAFLAVLSLGILNGCGNRSGVLAYVNGQPITSEEFCQYLRNKQDVTVQTDNGKFSLPVDGSLGFQAMRDEIDQSIELQIAKEKGLYPTDAEIEQEIKVKLRADPSYLLGLEAEGMTVDSIRRKVLVSLAEEKLVTQGVTVTKRDALAYVKRHQKQFLSKPQVKLSYIFVKEKGQIAAIDDQLQTGETFAEVARQYSQAPNAKNFRGSYTDPDKPDPTVDSLPATLQDAIAGLRDAESTTWIPFQGGFAKFYVEKYTPSERIVLDDDSIELLRRELARNKGAQAHNLAAMVQQKLEDSKVSFVGDVYKDEWESEQGS